MISVSQHNKINQFVTSSKKRGGTRAQAKQTYVKKNPLLWIVSAGFASALIASSIFMQFNFSQKPIIATQPAPVALQKEAEPNLNAEPMPPAPADSSTPTFDFYTVLPKMESSSGNTTNNVNKAIAVKTAAKPTVDKITKKYMIQIKTLDSLDAADALKAELILAGFAAQIEPNQKDNHTFYKILVGPFKSEQAAKLKQDVLIKQNIYGSFIKEQQ